MQQTEPARAVPAARFEAAHQAAAAVCSHRVALRVRGLPRVAVHAIERHDFPVCAHVARRVGLRRAAGARGVRHIARCGQCGVPTQLASACTCLGIEENFQDSGS